MKGFIEFIRRQGVVGLAVGFILGGAVSKVVSSIVSDIVNPLVSLLLPAKSLETATVTLGQATFAWGHFVAGLIDFIVIAAVVYLGVHWLKLDRLDRAENRK
jgi:large conductance mechanosensitive channel